MMTNSIKDILSGNTFAEPEEIRIIKNYIFEHFRSESQVTIGAQTITIKVNNGALAGTIRMYLNDIKKLCKTDKKLLVRIGR